MLLSGTAELEVGTRERGEGAMDGVGLVLVAAAERPPESVIVHQGRGEGLVGDGRGRRRRRLCSRSKYMRALVVFARCR